MTEIELAAGEPAPVETPRPDLGLEGVDFGPGPFTIVALASLDPADLCRAALVEAAGLIDEQIAWLTAVRAGHLAVLADRHAADPADDGREWEREELAARCAISGWESGRRVRTAIDLHSGRLPATATALRAGKISWRHAEALSVQTGDLPDPAAQRIERRVLADDRVVTARQTEARARKLASAFDPHPEQGPDPSLRVDSAVCGSVRFETWLPEPDAAVVMTALDALATRTDADDHRPVAWRRADALTELCRAALDRGLPAGGNGVRPHLTLLADAADWTAGRSITLAGVGTLPAVELHPAVARELTCDAGVAVGTCTDGQLDDLEAERRFPGAALRRRLETRDQGCRFPGCTRIVTRCHTHHVVHWADGGPTIESNLLLLCARHHHAVHDSQWQLSFDGATARWTDPHGRPYHQRSPLARPPDADGAVPDIDLRYDLGAAARPGDNVDPDPDPDPDIGIAIAIAIDAPDAGGETGPPGAAGGETGPPGAAGVTGTRGVAGDIGPPGAGGETGTRGAAGVTGTRGTAGRYDWTLSAATAFPPPPTVRPRPQRPRPQRPRRDPPQAGGPPPF